MARNRRSKQKHTTRKNRNAIETAQIVASNSTYDEEFSNRLARVLNNFAVNEHLIQFRRKIYLSHEREQTIVHNAIGRNRRTYFFGSQSEGTTTIGMMSDCDKLERFDMFRVFLDSNNPPLQPHDHQIAIKVSTDGYAPQYCVLKMIEPSTQAQLFQPLDPYRNSVDIIEFYRWDWTKTDGMIPHTFMLDFQNKHLKRHGPAKSIGNLDIVNACYCKSLPKQCTFVFVRPRPGHWPSEKTLNKAKKYGVFIVPQGPPKSTNICTSDLFHYQWRISTNLTERIFMFSLDTVHLQAYVLTKMIRKELFVPQYQDRLSTFHFKTAFFFTVETTRPDLWRDDNIFNCVKYILETLRRFLKRHNCPHFTIDNVNLFDGKIERHEFPKLVEKLTYVLKSLRITIENIQMDNIGKSLNERYMRKCERNRYCMDGSALLKYVLIFFQGAKDAVFGFDLSRISVNDKIALFENVLKRLETYGRAPLGKYRKYYYALHNFMSYLGSWGASVYLEQKSEGRDYNHDDINKTRHMFTQSLESDIIDNYMRYASFLFCNREYDAACKYFYLIEKQIEEDNKYNLIYQLLVSPSESLALHIAKQSSEKYFKQKWSVFLIFRQVEVMCVPEFLRCEMYRGRFGTFASSNSMFPFYSTEDCICVQIEPYLYYLQYLTYRELHDEPKQSEAFIKLSVFTEKHKPTRFIRLNGDILLSFAHFDTSLNMLGHCFELEQNLVLAWTTYTISLQMLPHRNAAALHLIRLLWHAYTILRTEGLQSRNDNVNMLQTCAISEVNNIRT